ncbi:hypothetical protein DMC47_10715 [Nostoc sp. 3335mG]|nr:hypothetical protein DMC47_10715 [Nostoc sp. 3335mG]
MTGQTVDPIGMALGMPGCDTEWRPLEAKVDYPLLTVAASLVSQRKNGLTARLHWASQPTDGMLFPIGQAHSILTRWVDDGNTERPLLLLG